MCWALAGLYISGCLSSAFWQEDKQFFPPPSSKSSESSFFKLSDLMLRLSFQGDSFFCNLHPRLPELRPLSSIESERAAS
jgi:hypothetical protein